MKYKTDRKWALSGAALLAIGLAILWTNPNTLNYFPTALGMTVFLFYAILWSFFGLYVTIIERRVCHTNYFFLKKCLDVDNISSIYYQPSWAIGQAARSLNIIDLSTGVQRHISLPNLGFSEKTLALIARDLKNLNPSIQLDQQTEALIKKYAAS